MSEPSTDLILPSGELVSLDDAAACAVALDELRALEYRIRELKATIVETLDAYSTAAGKGHTHHVGDVTFIVTRGTEIVWDVERLEAGLRYAGMSEERLSEIIYEEVTRHVRAGEAKKAASVNAAYAEVVAACRQDIPKRPSVTVKR